jgi:serine/threonine-protein kinase
MQELQAGRAPDRAKFLAEHPELAGMFDCLEALEELAPAPRQRPNYFDPDRTLDTDTPEPDPAHALSLEGVQFGKYELLGEIGRGGMGVIYKARQVDLERTVAIKMILSSHLASPKQVERFVAEAKTMAKVRHPNIVRIHETGEIHGQHYFVMELITGASLAEESRKRSITPEKAARLVALVARAVQHLHEQGMVHRDLKPSNILLDEDANPYVTDFGLVKLLGTSNQTASGAIIGTPAYMAPEQTTGRPEQVGPLSDVYSLGAILYELLTGRPPFYAETPLDTLVQVIESEPVPPRLIKSDLPRQLETICLKCLEKDPAERYVSAGALADDLERFLSSEEIEARSQGAVQFLRRWARREPALVYRLAGLAMLIVIVQINYHLTHVVSRTVHVEVLTLLVAWIGASVICQQWLNRDWRPDLARMAWVGADVCVLTSLLSITRGYHTPILVGYPFVIAASGLWFAVPLVWFTTIVCESAYALLIFTSAGSPYRYLPHYHIIFMVALAVLGFVVAYQVQRIRVLNRYYENRRLG